MKKLCISLTAALIITAAAGAEPLTTAEGFGIFIPSQSVGMKENKKHSGFTVINKRNEKISFGLAITELFEKLFG